MLRNISKNSLAISSVTVIDVHTGQKDIMDILIKEDRIAELGLSGTLDFPPETPVINAVGQYAIPGLWDMHIHMTVWPECIDSIAALMIANGITSVRDMGGCLEDVLSFREKTRQDGFVSPRVWMAGPIVDGSPRIADGGGHGPDISVEVNTSDEAILMVDALVKQGIDFIKPYEMLRPDVFNALVQRAQHYNLPASGHLPIRMTIPQALEAGPYDIQHLGGLCASMKYSSVNNAARILDDKIAILDTHEPGMCGADVAMRILSSIIVTPEEQDSARIAELIQVFVEKDTWHTPTLVLTAGVQALQFDEDPYYLDTTHYLPELRQHKLQTARGSTEDPLNVNDWRDWHIKIVGQMHRAGVKLLAGTDCPPIPDFTPGFCLHLELKALTLAGLSPLEALQTATVNPAEFFKITNDLGSIEQGKFADIVLLEADPLVDIDNCRRISSVISRGRLYDRSNLDELLCGISERKE